MPNQPLLKLCLTCDQISTARSRSRNPQCYAPVPPEGKPCRSRQVRLITVRDLNLERLAMRAEFSDLRTEFEVTRKNHEARISELEEMFASLRR